MTRGSEIPNNCHLNEVIQLDKEESTLDPNSADPCGAHADDEKAELDKIIQDFNERWFANWDATAEEKREVFFTFIG